MYCSSHLYFRNECKSNNRFKLPPNMFNEIPTICPTYECCPDEQTTQHPPQHISSPTGQLADKWSADPCALLASHARTEYQHSYGYSDNSLRDRTKRAVRLPPSANWSTDTTYQSSWRSLQQIRGLCNMDWYKRAELANSLVAEQREAALRMRLGKLMAGGISEYQHRIGEQAEWSMGVGKYGRPRKEGYVDRYTKNVPAQ